MRLDLTVPTPPPEIADRLGDASLVPVGFLQKQKKFRPLVCRSSGQHDLPVLTQRTRTVIASKGLVAYARGAFDERNVDERALDSFLADLEGVVTADIALAVTAVSPFLPAGNSSAEDEAKLPDRLETSEDFTRVLRAHRLFPTVAWNLATHFMLLVPLPVAAAERYLVTYSLSEKIVSEPVSKLDRVLRFAGFYAHRFQFPALSAADADSFHFLFQAPPGLQVTRGEFRVSRTPLTDYSMRRGSLDSGQKSNTSDGETGWGSALDCS